MKILISGCHGFIGGTLGRAAAAAGHEVMGIGRAAQPPRAWPGAYVTADVVQADLSSLIREFAPDAIFHAAGTASVAESFAAPLDDLRASVMSWANLLDSVRRCKLSPLILFPSSAAVYGQVAELPIKEDAPIQPISPYGFHKAACELIAREYAKCFGLRVIICRFFSLFGERQRRLLVWELFAQFVGPSEIVWLQGTGEETRDHLAASDMTKALLLLMDSDQRLPVGSDCLAVNVASGHEMKVINLAKQTGRLLGSNKDVRCRGLKRQGDPTRWQADTALLQSLIPTWSPKPLEERLADCLSNWQQT